MNSSLLFLLVLCLALPVLIEAYYGYGYPYGSYGGYGGYGYGYPYGGYGGYGMRQF